MQQNGTQRNLNLEVGIDSAVDVLIPEFKENVTNYGVVTNWGRDGIKVVKNVNFRNSNYNT